MSNKLTKLKRKNIPGITMAELINRGELAKYEFLKDHVEINQEERYSFNAWLQNTIQDIMQ